MNYRTLLTQGRKAGLQTRELYQALASRRPETPDRPSAGTDCNGYISVYGPNGEVVYRPSSAHGRP